MGIIIPPVKVPLNTSTFVPVSMQQNLSPRDIAVYTEDGTDWVMSSDEAGTDAVTIPGGSSLSYGNVDSYGVIMYAKAVAGTPNLVLLTGVSK